MRKNISKKGAVELSLNLIIMLIIGLVVLGLIIGFVTNFMSQAQDSVKLTADDEQKLKEVLGKSGTFEVLSPKINIRLGGKAAPIYFKIRNPTDSEFSFDGGDVVASSGDFTVEVTEGIVDQDGTSGNILINSQPMQVASAEQGAYVVYVQAPSGVSLGTYYAKFTLTLGLEEYNQMITIIVE